MDTDLTTADTSNHGYEKEWADHGLLSKYQSAPLVAGLLRKPPQTSVMSMLTTCGAAFLFILPIEEGASQSQKRTVVHLERAACQMFMLFATVQLRGRASAKMLTEAIACSSCL